MKILLETKLLALFFLFFLFNQIRSQLFSDLESSSESSSDSSQEEQVSNSCLISDFIAAIEAISDQGKQFEVVSAFCLQILGEKVLGMNLMIEVLDSDPKYILLSNDNWFQLKTTEFDVVTTDNVFECKSLIHPNKIQKTKKMNQFLKERDMLEFFKKVYLDLQHGCLSFKVAFNKKSICVLTICGRSTLFQEVSLASNWVKGNDLECCEQKWKDIIHFLSDKKLIVMFKQKISSPLKTKLLSKNLGYKDDVSYRHHLLYTAKVEQAIKKLRALEIS